MISRSGYIYRAMQSRNASKPGSKFEVLNELWKYIFDNSATVTDWLLGISMVLLGIAKFIAPAQLSSFTLICYSLSAVIVHELSVR